MAGEASRTRKLTQQVYRSDCSCRAAAAKKRKGEGHGEDGYCARRYRVHRRIYRDGRVEAFDGDLDDYRLALLNRKVQPAPAPTLVPAKSTRQKPVSKKNLQSRIQRLEEHMKRLGGEIAAVEARLGDPATYQDAESVKRLLADQAYLRRELDQAETEWLARQAELES